MIWKIKQLKGVQKNKIVTAFYIFLYIQRYFSIWLIIKFNLILYIFEQFHILSTYSHVVVVLKCWIG